MHARLAVAIAVGALLTGLAVGYSIQPSGGSLDVAFDDDRSDAGSNAAIPEAIIQRSRAVAKKVWGEVCDGRVTISFGQLSGRQSGKATYDYDPYHPLDTRRYGHCAITVNDRIRFAPGFFCAVIAHEWGHLSGEGHVSDPRRLMYPRLTAANVPSSCR